MRTIYSSFSKGDEEDHKNYNVVLAENYESSKFL
jgi:hypothetical protein